MSIEEIRSLFVVIMGCDNRHDPGLTTEMAWQAGIDSNITLSEASAAVVAHYAESRDFVMIADINRRCRAVAARAESWAYRGHEVASRI
ncbi:hypothetical protein [Microbacterium sp. cf332]|uniref:hypothetical protein n=1 Tax=Microbacterium sp. cf332 TaxID=1761804 RepID=UPI0008852B7A|nr:hypothetical protein [Microbacterium sp. cf332]SDQ16410.1 hypothetical protein SAMN04487847_0680 [Microbacterium sp. cf332]